MAVKKSELYRSLWSSCDELRGGMDASQYKDYVLTLLFVKYVSDKYAGKHDRGPKTPYEFEKSGKQLQKIIDELLKGLSVLVQYPLRLVQDLNIDWRTSEVITRTLLYTGDHPGMRQEFVALPHSPGWGRTAG